ncbi:alpha/beta fold hydrolase [Amycolatopsis sp. cmx-4-68]|uniref:alpha/beta fold hydrolase n=1 Tax=Amycolatopsis sp. cmx-4-68 TaxID=2790938 RepID=UPI00397E6E81
MRTGTVAVGGITLAYREFGDREDVPVVLLHALGSRAGTWDRFAAELAGAGRHVIAPDLRGHGESSWPGEYSFELSAADVLGFLDRRGTDRADLVGHSLGGRVAQSLAQRHPHRVRRLVIEEAPVPPRQDTGQRAQPPERPDEPVDFDWSVVAPTFRQARHPDPDWWARLPAITATTLVISGGPASHVSPAALAEVAMAMPDATLVTIPDAGHRVHSTRPDEFSAAVLPFLT